MSTETTKNLLQIEDSIIQLSKFSDFQSDYSSFSTLVCSSLIKNYEFLKLVCLVEKFENYFFMRM